MKRDFGDEFEKVLKALKRELPVSKAVRVISVRPETLKKRWPDYNHLCGDCLFNDKNFLIRINCKCTAQCAIDTIVHEYAHCLTPKDCHTETKSSHTDAWGVAYAQCYRVYESV